MGYVILWLASLASFWVSFALRNLWLRRHKPGDKGRFSFEIIAGLSLLLAGASSYKALEPFPPRWLTFILVILINGFLGLLLSALGDKASIYLRALEGLADFLALLLAPMAALYEKTVEKGSEAIYVVKGEEREIVEGALDLGETIVREIMVPRVDVVAIRADSTVSEAVKVATESGHSRIPAYEGSIDNIIGIVHVKDLLRKAWEGQWNEPVKAILRPPYFIPETKNAAELLREMQSQKIHMAIVVDEYGGTAGIITLEDLLEEILGEIQDEYDREEPFIQEIGEGEYILDARVSLEDLEEIIGKELDLEGIDTVGGLVYSSFGRVPEKYARFNFEGFEFEVLSLVGRRVRKVRLRKITPKEGGDGGGKSEAMEQEG